MDRVGHPELRQGAADAGGQGGARRSAGAVPRRSSGGQVISGVIGSDEIRAVAQAALDLRGADGVEVLVIHGRGGLTRFANSSIHQSTAQEDTGVRVRVVK